MPSTWNLPLWLQLNVKLEPHGEWKRSQTSFPVIISWIWRGGKPWCCWRDSGIEQDVASWQGHRSSLRHWPPYSNTCKKYNTLNTDSDKLCFCANGWLLLLAHYSTKDLHFCSKTSKQKFWMRWTLEKQTAKCNRCSFISPGPPGW